MVNYLIKKKSNHLRFISIPVFNGYSFKPKLNSDKYIVVSEVIIINRQMIDDILTIKFEKNFKRLVALALNVINDEDETDDSKASIVLGEIELVRGILLNRYQKFLNHQKEELFLQKLRLIENEMRMKQVAIKQKAMYLEQMEYQNSRGRSR